MVDDQSSKIDISYFTNVSSNKHQDKMYNCPFKIIKTRKIIQYSKALAKCLRAAAKMWVLSSLRPQMVMGVRRKESFSLAPKFPFPAPFSSLVCVVASARTIFREIRICYLEYIFLILFSLRKGDTQPRYAITRTYALLHFQLISSWKEERKSGAPSFVGEWWLSCSREMK